MLDVFIERGMQRLRSGQMKVSGRDLVGALRKQAASRVQRSGNSSRSSCSTWLGGNWEQRDSKPFRSEVARQIRV
jgi:hypothetical protein